MTAISSCWQGQHASLEQPSLQNAIKKDVNKRGEQSWGRLLRMGLQVGQRGQAVPLGLWGAAGSLSQLGAVQDQAPGLG